MGTGRLGSGESLRPGQSVFSEDNSVEFRFQDDGKITVYHGSNCVWQNTAEQRYDLQYCTMGKDGILTLGSEQGLQVWKSDNPPQAYSSLAVQNDGNVVIYSPVWATESNK